MDRIGLIHVEIAQAKALVSAPLVPRHRESFRPKEIQVTGMQIYRLISVMAMVFGL